METRDDLKACPFCGSAANIRFDFKHDYVVFCTNDDCMLNELEYGFDSEEEAIETWNRRTNDAEVH